MARRLSRKWFNRVPAEDLAQVALFAGVIAFRRFDPGLGVPVHIWLKQKMRYAALDAVQAELHIGRLKCTAATDALEQEAEVNLPALNRWPGIEARLDIEVALRCLSPREREVIDRRYLHAQLHTEIGAALGIGFSRVSQIEMAACRKMRAAFAPCGSVE